MTENNSDDFKQISKEEKDKLAHEIVMGQFLLTKTIATVFGGRWENKEIVTVIMEESTKELEKYLEKKWNLLL